MIRALLFAALTSLILLGGVPESARVTAQEIITATGSVDARSMTELGLDLESSEIELHFPAEGGAVTGMWTIRIRFEFVDRQPNGTEERCVYIGTASGPLEGTYDGGTVRDGKTTGAGSTSVIEGCTGIEFDTDPETYEWSAAFDGQRVHVTFDSPEFPVEFSALVTSEEDADAGDEDVEQPPDAAEDGAAEDEAEDGDDQGLVNVESEDLLTRTIIDSLLSAEDFIDCGPDSGQTLSQGCDGLVQATTVGVRIRPKFLDAVGVVDGAQATEREMEIADLLAVAASLAAAEGRDGLPLYPSVRTALPVIVSLSGAAVADDPSRTALERFVDLLGRRDQDTWEERFK